MIDIYCKVGFIFGIVFLLVQMVGEDYVVQICVFEGMLGCVIVKGNKCYCVSVIVVLVELFKGKVLCKGDVDIVLFYVCELLGVLVSFIFQFGEKIGQIDLLMVVNEVKCLYIIIIGVNNYGIEFIGCYCVQLGVIWNSLLGIGDSFIVNVDYVMDLCNNVYGVFVYCVLIVVVLGLSGVIGVICSELQLFNGIFVVLDVKGFSLLQYVGVDWKFVNIDMLQMQVLLYYICECFKFISLGILLLDECFDVVELVWVMNCIDQKLYGIDLLQVSVCKLIVDCLVGVDLVSFNYVSSFFSMWLLYICLQFFIKLQCVYFKFGGQWINDVLVLLEQFVIGGLDSVCVYLIVDGLSDCGYYVLLEYYVDVLGFGDKVLLFYVCLWCELLELEVFVDYVCGFFVGVDCGVIDVVIFKGVGVGLIFCLLCFYCFEFYLDGLVLIGGLDVLDKKGYYIYLCFGFMF